MEARGVAAEEARWRDKVVALALPRGLLEADNGQLVAVALVSACEPLLLLEQLDHERVRVDGHEQVEHHAVYGCALALGRVVHALRHVGQLDVALADGRRAAEQRAPERVVARQDSGLAQRVELARKAARVDAVKRQAPRRVAARVLHKVLQDGGAQRVVEARPRGAVVHEQPHIAPFGAQHLLGELVRLDARHELIGAHRCLRRALGVARLLRLKLGARHRARLVEHDDHVPRRLDGGRNLAHEDLHVLAVGGRGLRHALDHDVAVEHRERLGPLHPDHLAQVVEPRARQKRRRKLLLEDGLAPVVAALEPHSKNLFTLCTSTSPRF